VLLLPGALPKTTSGKVQRRSCRTAYLAGRLETVAETGARALTERPTVEPRTRDERTLARIWADLLGLGRVGIHDNFFELGGDSIVAVQIAAAARRVGLALVPRDVFERPTIAELALVLDGPRPDEPAGATTAQEPAPHAYRPADFPDVALDRAALDRIVDAVLHDKKGARG
jgi:predicted nucleic acid-binding protein